MNRNRANTRIPARGRASRSRRVAPLAATSVLALLLTPLDSAAQEQSCDGVGDYPCGYQIQDHQLQKVPQRLKFQARISQAKLPVGEAVFNTIFVKVVSGTDVLCSEQFTNIEVHESVLNLTIGAQMDCALDEVIAENANLAFQLCLGGQDTCLQAIELAAVPYAIKSSFASTSQFAHSASVAGQSFYSHRNTADRDLQLTRRLGTGYFDYYTPPMSKQGSLYSDSDYAPFQDGGFLAWTPVRDRSALNLHIVGKSADSDELTELDNLVLGSESTRATGTLLTDKTLTVSDGGVIIQGGGATITGNSTISGTLLISQQTSIQSGGLFVTAGGADVTGTVMVRGGNLDVEQDVIANRDLFTTGKATIGTDLTVAGASTFAGPLVVNGTSTFPGGIVGPANVTGSLSVSGAATFNGVVTFAGGVSIAGQPGPIPNSAVNDGSASHLYINRDAAGAANGDYDFLYLSGIQGMSLSGGSGRVNIETDAHVDGGFSVDGAVTMGDDLTVTGALTAASITIAGGQIATAHNHPYASDSHLHNSDYSQLGHTHSYADPAHNHSSTYAALAHVHSDVASSTHSHSGFADASHGHSGFAASSHGHSDKADATHSHASSYASTSHGHTEFTSFALATHEHASSGSSSGGGFTLGTCADVSAPANCTVDQTGTGFDELVKMDIISCPADRPIMRSVRFEKCTANGSDDNLRWVFNCCAGS